MTKFSKEVENTVAKGEMLVTRISPFFTHSVFKRLVLQTRKNKGLFGKGLACRTQDLVVVSSIPG